MIKPKQIHKEVFQGIYQSKNFKRLIVIVTYLHALESEAWLSLTSCVTLGDLLTSLNLSLLTC